MSNAKHTPGPWKIQRFVGSKNVSIAAPGPHAYHDDIWVADTVAGPNADLMAASPQLYAALEALVEIIKPWPMPGMRAEFDRAVAALKAARGEA